MQPTEEFAVPVFESNNALTWYAHSAADRYFVPRTHVDVRKVRLQLHALPNGACLPVRARDFVRVSDLHAASTASGGVTAAGTVSEARRADDHPKMGPFDYGIAVKNGARLFFLYESGDIESLLIDGW
jgi:hypothetical protein